MSWTANSAMPFADRREAGVELAEKVAAYRGRTDVVVLALPRGGVPVAYEVARSLSAPLDIFVVFSTTMSSGGIEFPQRSSMRWRAKKQSSSSVASKPIVVSYRHSI